MKLYYATGVCSLSPHIICREAGVPVELEPVNIRTGHYRGGDFKKVNPKGYVPAVELPDGTILTEGVVIAQYIADLHPEKKLLPPPGTMERVRCTEWQLFISTEIHKGYGPLFHPEVVSGPARDFFEKTLLSKFEYVNERLGAGPYLMGAQFTVADAYLFTVLNWAPLVKLDLSRFENIRAFAERVRERPAVREALRAEGLLKEA